MCANGEINTQIRAEGKVRLTSQKHWSLLVVLRMQAEKESSATVILNHSVSVAVHLGTPLSFLSLKMKLETAPLLQAFVMCQLHTAAHASAGQQGTPARKTACLQAESLYFWKACGPTPAVPRVRSCRFS